MKLRITQATDLFLHKTIVAVRCMTNEEARALGWSDCPVMLQLSTGEWVYPALDGEGSGPGALVTTSVAAPSFPPWPPF